jgi:hypothetical protein
MLHEKMIAQSRDRQRADPLADARLCPYGYFRNGQPIFLK